MISFASVLDVFRRVFPPALISSEAVRQMSDAVGDLPDALSAGYILECRLNEDSAVDLGVVVDPTINQGRALLAANDLSDRLRSDPIWQKIAAFSRLWDDPNQLLHEQIGTVWLEFDIDGTPHPLPSFFYGPQPEAWRHSGDQVASSQAFQWLIEALQVLEPTLRDVDYLKECLAAVPRSAEVFQLGLMLARGEQRVRLCVRGNPDADLLAYLPNLGWQGDAPALRNLLTTLANLVDSIALDVDVSNKLGERVGIECRFDQWKQPSQEPRWQAFLDYLVTAGLCTPAKRDALLTWPTSSYHRFPEERLPRVLIRALNHIKIVIEPGKPLTAKAYVWFGTRSADYMKARQEQRKVGS